MNSKLSLIVFVTAAFLASGCKLKVNRTSTFASTSQESSNDGEGRGPGPAAPNPATCNYSNGVRDLSVQPLTQEPLLVTLRFPTSGFTAIPLISTDGGATFGNARTVPIPTGQGCNAYFNNAGRLAYFCIGGSASNIPTSNGSFFQSTDNGATWQATWSFTNQYRPVTFSSSSGQFYESSGTLLAADARFVRDLTFQLAPNSTLGDVETTARIHRINSSGQVTVIDDFLPAGYDAAEAMAVTRVGNTIVYAGFAEDIVVNAPNYRIDRAFFVRRSADGGTTWSTLQLRPLGAVDGWNNPELFALPDGSVAAYASYSVGSVLGQIFEVIRPGGAIEDRTNLFANEYLRPGFAVSPGGTKLAIVTNKITPNGTFDGANRAIHVVDLNTLTQVVHDFKYKNHASTSFETVRFTPTTGDVMLTGWGTTNSVREYFAIAVNCR